MKLKTLMKQAKDKYDPTPVGWVKKDGVLVEHDGTPWLYRVMPQESLAWEDSPVKNKVADRWYDLFTELSTTGRKSPMGSKVKIGSVFREFHLLCLHWDTAPEIPEGTSPELAESLNRWFNGNGTREEQGFLVTKSLLVMGVKLQTRLASGDQGFFDYIAKTVDNLKAKEPEDHSWAADKSKISPMVARAGGRAPTQEEVDRMEFWFNDGVRDYTIISPEPDLRSISCDKWPGGLEFSALIGARDAKLDSRNGLWISDAFNHQNGCVAVSIRGEIWPPDVVKERARKSQRKMLARIEEEAQTGDLEREENYRGLEEAQEIESMFSGGGGEPLIKNSSIIFARRKESSHDSYADMLRTTWGLDTKIVAARQIEALEETLPCGIGRLAESKAFVQDYTVGTLALSGISSFPHLGDKDGVWIGLAVSEMVPVWLDPEGSSRQNKAPSMAVVGEPGVEKHSSCSCLPRKQAAMGVASFTSTLNRDDSLSDFCKASGGETIFLSALTSSTGLLDPFRFADPSTAATYAKAHIECGLQEMTEEENVQISSGILKAARGGAKCVGEALEHPDIPDRVRKLIKQKVEGDPLFALGVSYKPKKRLGLLERQSGITLIEFDRQIPIPSTAGSLKDYTPEERSAVAAIRLIAKASMEQMFQSDGGVLIIDEAHVFMGSQEGKQILQRLGREGRSQRILPILATQRIADVIGDGADMESYLGRALILKMTDPKEVEASLRLAGLENTPARAHFLANAGPDRKRGLPAHGIFKDLEGRRGAIMVGPVPKYVEKIFSTNPDDRDEKEKALAKEAGE